jgi:hypothetical protein
MARSILSVGNTRHEKIGRLCYPIDRGIDGAVVHSQFPQGNFRKGKIPCLKCIQRTR